jgi:hypothetical protein
VLHPRHKLLFYTISHYIWFFCDFNFVYTIQLRLCYNCLRFVNCNIVLLYTFHLRISTRFLRFRNASVAIGYLHTATWNRTLLRYPKFQEKIQNFRNFRTTSNFRTNSGHNLNFRNFRTAGTPAFIKYRRCPLRSRLRLFMFISSDVIHC